MNKALCVFLILYIMLGNEAIGQQVSTPDITKTVIAGKSIPLKQISSGGVIHRFFDTSPMSPSGRYVALFRLPYEQQSPKPGDAGEVILVDLKTGKERVVANTRGWETQLGANVQWGKSDLELLFNDVDTTAWKAYGVVLNPFTGKKRKLDGTVFMVSNDGKRAASYNLLSSP
ncbi:MAG TPA: hypothetical protein VM935_20470, partial [Chitinophagaceae bacterium]|nr:hypothetical protein [Chitinophagaceae bacterium]